MKLTVAMVILWWKLTFTMVIYGENWQQPKRIFITNPSELYLQFVVCVWMKHLIKIRKQL
jgi:hypothetical protein